MEQWEKNFYISSIAGANNGSSLVVMSKGMFAVLVFLHIDGSFDYGLMERSATYFMLNLYWFHSPSHGYVVIFALV